MKGMDKMSVSFYIKNKKKLFGFGGIERVLNVEEALLISENVEQFTFSEEEVSDNPELLKNSLEEIYLIMGIYEKSFRGFELHYEGEIQSYSVRINTPSTKTDWLIALNYIKSLASYLKSDIECENGEKYNSENIMRFNFLDDIRFGIKSMQDIADSEDYSNSSIHYAILGRKVCFNREMIKKIINSEDPVQEYEKTVNEVVYANAYFANQAFFKKTDTEEIIGRYVLSENLRTILPYKPAVEFFNSNEIVNNENIKKWILCFVAFENNKEIPDVGEMDYSDFIKFLPKEKYSFIDAEQILVEEMTSNEIREIYKDVFSFFENTVQD